MEYQRPSSSWNSRSGNSVTHTKAKSSGLARFSFFAIARRSWPRSFDVASAGPAAISSRSSFDAPARSSAGRSVASPSAFTDESGGSPGRTQMRPVKPICLAWSTSRSIWLRLYLLPPGTTKPRTTPPSATICLNTRNSASRNSFERSTISRPKRRSGLSDPYLAIASAYGIRRNGIVISRPISLKMSRISGSIIA